MLRMIQNSSSSGAKRYFSKADYYLEGQELAGQWLGKGAEKLGLQGEISQADFDSLCDNRIPGSNERLTPRTKADRTVGYDFNFHVPKGVSLAYMLNGDSDILDAFRDSVRETMQEIELDAQTRVRKQGRDDDRTTGNLTWAEFVHFTARPVEGIPDPHLHAHCFVFNQTFDQEEERWKAVQFRQLKQDAPYYQAIFHSKLASNLQELGYSISRKGKDWELSGITKSLDQKFSRRTDQIEELAQKKGILDPQEKDQLGAKTREKKNSNLSLPELKKLWQERLSDEDPESLGVLVSNKGRERSHVPNAVELATAHAIEHCFERHSVYPMRRLLAEGLRHGLGDVTGEEIRRELDRRGVITRRLDGREMATTREVLAEEQAMIDFARLGRGKEEPLSPGWKIGRSWLDEGQQAAVQHVAESRDRVMMIRGMAGTGKTSLMQEAVDAIKAGGHRVLALAPSSEASRGVLRKEGFADATTVAELLVNEKLQQNFHGQILWIDEAGLIGTRQLKQVFDLADRMDSRVILSGDWRQHGSVERGSAMRLLEQESGIRPAIVNTIRRQQGIYKEAVSHLAHGRTASGFELLDQLGWIRETSDEERCKVIAKEFADSLAGSGETPLVIAPTHAEGRQITGAIRNELKERCLLGAIEHSLPRLTSLNLTKAERADPAMIEAGDVIVFTQNAPGHKKGDRLVITDTLPEGLAKYADRYQVTKLTEEGFAVGDPIRFTSNGKTKDGKHRLNNGAIHRIANFTKGGDIVLDNNWVVSQDYGFISPGYVVTSHASQGKTFGKVLISESSHSLAAASAEQLYVSVSRGKQEAIVFTDDKQLLRDAVTRTTPRLAATELIKMNRRQRSLEHAARQEIPIPSTTHQLEQSAYDYR